ncbi:hypothetical protein C8R47DRAFT_1071589 [Mycena vitilis]|nr:hypothetical protein C8R47DRAFT_1071589 [Mycena vitilis]
MSSQLRRLVYFTMDGQHHYVAAITVDPSGAFGVEVQGLGQRRLDVGRYLRGESVSESHGGDSTGTHNGTTIRAEVQLRLLTQTNPYTSANNKMTTLLPRYPPTSILPEMDYDFVQYTRDAIASEAGIHSKTVKAILIPDGTALSRWVWTRVPLHAGIQRAYTVDEVDTDVWFDAGRGAGTATSDLTNRSFQINRFPLDEPSDLKHSYTIVVAPQHTVGSHVHPINHQINALVPTLGVSWRGNVLVFRHGKTANKVLINVEDKNWDAIELIVTTTRCGDKGFSRGRSDLSFKPAMTSLKWNRGGSCRKSSPKTMAQVATSTRRSSRFTTLRTHAFWDTGDVVLYMLRFFGLAHILLFSHIDGRCRAYATMYIKGRVLRYISPFFTRSHYNGPAVHMRSLNLDRFLAVLEETKSWIVGSVPLAVASTLSDVPVPSNLNIITYGLRYPVWRDFFVFQARFRVLNRYWSTGPYAASGRQVVVFAHPQILNFTISITTSNVSNLGALFFASPNTDQLVAISSHALMTPVLANVSRQQHIKGWRPDARRHPLMDPEPESTSIATSLRPNKDPSATSNVKPIPFTSVYTGLFFGIGADEPTIVPVPSRLGMRSYARSHDDLDTTWWVPVAHHPNASSIDLERTRLTVSHWPFESPAVLSKIFTICVAPQEDAADTIESEAPPVNLLFKKESEGWLEPFRGNVLVVAKTNSGPLVDVASEDIGLISALVRRLSRVNRLLRTCGSEIFHMRVVRRVSINLESGTWAARLAAVTTLLQLLDGEGACVVGSTVQSLLCFTADNEGPINAWPPRDLNLLVTEALLRQFFRVFSEYFGLRSPRVERVPRAETRGLVSAVYVFGNGSITVSAVIGPSVLPALLASRTTSQMNALTRTHLISFQPRMTSGKTGLLAWPAAAWGITSHDDFFPYGPPPLMDLARLLSNTSAFVRCGRACPRLWRQTAGSGRSAKMRGVNFTVETTFEIDGLCYCTFAMYSSIPLEIETSFLEDAEYGDIVRYSHVGTHARAAAQSVLALRCSTLLLRFFAEHDLSDFWKALNDGHGGLTGSAPVWVSQPAPDWNPTDLNAVVSRGRGTSARNFFDRNGWTSEVGPSRELCVSRRDAVTTIAAYGVGHRFRERFWRYTKPGRPSITLTETGEPNVLMHLTWAPHTMATMLLTMTSIIALHPYECVRQLSTWREGWRCSRADQARLERRVAVIGGTDMYFATTNGTCGARCPGALRRLRGGAGVGLLRWNNVRNTTADDAVPAAGYDVVARDAYSAFLDDSYAFGWTWCSCTNYACDTFGFPRQLFPSLPIGRRLSSNPKENVLLRIQHCVNHSDPVCELASRLPQYSPLTVWQPFPQLYDGLLFPTSCGNPMLVPVPLDHGLAVYCTPDDLRIHTWLKPRVVGIPPSPLFMPPHSVVGGPNILYPLAWRVPYRIDGYLLVFMTSVHEAGPLNTILATPSVQLRAVYGDVLLMLEQCGVPLPLALHDTVVVRDLFLQCVLYFSLPRLTSDSKTVAGSAGRGGTGDRGNRYL